MKAKYHRPLTLAPEGGTIVGIPKWKMRLRDRLHHKLVVARDGMSASLFSDTRDLPEIKVTADGSDGRKHTTKMT